MKSIICARFAPIAMVMALVFSSGSFAAGGNYSSDVDLDSIIDLIDAGKYQSAIDQLHEELDQDPDNPDIMSLLGFSYRKTQNYENALTMYQWALKVEPRHRGANEYLGELYLETDQFDKAMQQLEILDSLCTFNCKEYSTLKKAIDTYQKSASNS
jgi:tetratricopeptide (TPR) repeat protein